MPRSMASKRLAEKNKKAEAEEAKETQGKEVLEVVRVDEEGLPKVHGPFYGPQWQPTSRLATMEDWEGIGQIRAHEYGESVEYAMSKVAGYWLYDIDIEKVLARGKLDEYDAAQLEQRLQSMEGEAMEIQDYPGSMELLWFCMTDPTMLQLIDMERQSNADAFSCPSMHDLDLLLLQSQ